MAVSSAAFGLGDIRFANVCRIAGCLPMPGAIAASLLLGVMEVHVVLAVAAFLVNVTAALATVELLRRHGPVSMPERAQVAALIHYGWRAHIGSISWAFNSKMDQLCLSLMVGPHALGLYAVAVSFSSPVLAVATSLAPIVLRETALKGEHADWRTPMAACAGIALLAAAAAPFVIPWVFGPAFKAATTAAVVLAIANGALGLAVIGVQTVRGHGRPLLASFADAAGLLCGVVLIPVLILAGGITGAAVGALASYTAAAVAATTLRRRLSRAPSLTWSPA
jgi:O-antigen/teichoic acid export membrane protein